MKALSYGLGTILALARGDDERLGMLVPTLFRCAAGKISEKLQPVSFIRGELILAATDQRWQSLGDQKEAELRKSLNSVFGRDVVKRIVIRRQRKSSKDTSSVAGKTVRAVTPAVAEAAQAIREPGVKSAFLNFAARLESMRAKKPS